MNFKKYLSACSPSVKVIPILSLGNVGGNIEAIFTAFELINC